MFEENRVRFQSNRQSDYQNDLGDITQIFDKYKQQHKKLSPLPLNQFSQIAQDEDVQLLSQPIEGQDQRFIPFKSLNLGTVAELKRSLLQSKLVWNSYSTSLFNDTQQEIDQNMDTFTQRQLQLLHNKETFRQIRRTAKKQQEQQIKEYFKVLEQVNYRSQGVRIYPSLGYQEQQRLDFLRKQNKVQCQQDNNEQEDLQRRITETNVALSLIKKQIVYAYKDEYCYWGPCSRDGATMVSFDRKLYLYGGAGVQKQEDFCYATTDKQFYKWNSVKLEEKSVSGYRVHHSASVYRSSMVIFGGEVHQVQTTNNQRINGECTSDIKIISLNSFDIKTFKQTGIQAPRKGHIGEVVGRSLLIQGGIDNRGQYLKDLILFDMVTQKWSVPQIDAHNLYQNGVSFHKSCAVLFNKQLDIYRGDSEVKNSNQGIYLFGGQDKLGNYLDTFARLNIYQKPISCELVQTKGIPPMARSQHSMTYNDYLQYIVVFGGKNDDQSEAGFLDDIFILEIKNLNWINVEIKGSILTGRCGHTASCIDTKLFIYGGYNYNGFVKSDVIVIELDNSNATSLNSADIFSEKALIEKHTKPLEKKTHNEVKTDRPDPRKNIIEDLKLKASSSALSLPFLQKRQSLIMSLFKSDGHNHPTRKTQSKHLSVIEERHRHPTVLDDKNKHHHP